MCAAVGIGFMNLPRRGIIIWLRLCYKLAYDDRMCASGATAKATLWQLQHQKQSSEEVGVCVCVGCVPSLTVQQHACPTVTLGAEKRMARKRNALDSWVGLAGVQCQRKEKRTHSCPPAESTGKEHVHLYCFRKNAL